jgi:hypothetical protein
VFIRLSRIILSIGGTLGKNLQKMSSKVSGWVADFIPKIIAA